MTENKDNATGSRSKLTLKLALKTTPESTAAAAPKAVEKRTSTAVQVTIKGRKPAQAAQPNANTGLSKSEFDARLKAIAGSSDNIASEDFNVLDKISKVTASEAEEKKSAAKEKKSAAKKVEEKTEEKIVAVAKESKAPQEEKKEAAPSPAAPDREIDSFNVRDKIKQSLEVSNREKAEREKLLEERRKQEQEKLEKEREAKAKSKKFVDEFESNNKKKPVFNKDSKINTRKLTYIIDEDSDSDGGGFYRKRKKHRDHHVVQEQKEYKKIIREVALPELITVADLADRMAEKTGDVVKKLFTMGMVATSNQVIDADTAELIISEFGHTAKRVSHSDVESVLTDEEDSSLPKLPRAPVVTIMGHVDHGKTSLLDAIRTTQVVAGEHGGITQHIGASRIQTPNGKFITFLDTPGHEAFTEMRSRGANITDIVVLVVAADDGVKEQTVEAISHAKAAKVPIIVAVNKIDKPGADPERVKHELLSHEIVAEDLGGDVMFIPVSAKQKLNLDKLEEAILLQAEVLDLKAAYEGASAGVVIESRVDPAQGVVVSLLVQRGTLDIGDLIVVGTSFGRVRKMSDDNGKNIKIASPSIPVEILGLNQAPNAGEKFFEVKEEKHAREIILYRERKEREEKSLKNSARSLNDIFRESGKGRIKNLNVLIKADVHGSVEAIVGTINKLSNDEVAIKVVHQGVGGITESDISLAAVSGAIIIGFNVRSNNAAKEIAKAKNVDIRYYSIIYNIVDDLKLLLSGMLDPSKNEEYLGQAEIRQVFKISSSGKIAGAFVTDGLIRRSAKIRLLRDNVVIHDGILKTLKRFKEDAKEVKSGFECGFSIENYEDIKEGDSIECYEVVEQKRSL